MQQEPTVSKMKEENKAIRDEADLNTFLSFRSIVKTLQKQHILHHPNISS